ncbi:hypothetical protein [Paenibacillus daejeonensis]|uniref:hypothetical protein n=1 Tax=Paenibacillus daejeonensis TaxID=135193 RepID=UPI000380092E|nr:hypothetical protein [Paenibacillus daejeonensis]
MNIDHFTKFAVFAIKLPVKENPGNEQGENEEFASGQTGTRAEAAVILLRALAYAMDE